MRGTVPRKFNQGRTLDNAIEAMDELIDTHLHATLDLPERIDGERLRRALDAVATAVPQLACRLVKRPFFSRWEPVDDAWSVDERAVSEKEAEELEAELFAQPYRPHATRPVRLRLLHMEDRDRLLLRVNHHLADGGGTKNLLYRLAQAYRRQGEEPGWRPAAQRLEHPALRLWRGLRLARLGFYLLGYIDELLSFLPLRSVALPMKQLPESRNRFVALHIDARRVDRLRQRWKPQGATLNDVLLTAFARMAERCFPHQPGEQVAVVSTADLRQLAPDEAGDDVSNFSSLRPLYLGRTPLPPAAEQLVRTRQVTRRWKRGGLGLPGSMLAVLLASALPDGLARRVVTRFLQVGVIANGARVAMTNIGPIHAERLDFGGGPCLAARVLAPVAHPPLLVTAVTGCAGALDFCVAYKEPAVERGQAQAMIEAMDQELAALE